MYQTIYIDLLQYSYKFLPKIQTKIKTIMHKKLQ